MTLTFPPHPQLNDQYVAENNIVYTWIGDHWSSSQAVTTNTANYFIDGEYASSTYDPQQDLEIDGGNA